jgi:hypothetical protein
MDGQRFAVCKYVNSPVIWSLLCITAVLAAIIGKRDTNTVTARFLESASMECQRFLVSRSWVIYLPNGHRHPFIGFWKSLLAKTTVSCSLWHSENSRQRSANGVSSCLFGNHCIAQIIALMIVLLSALISKNTINQW